MHTNPLVSILCLSYNHERYIEQCLRSLVSQTYVNKEIIFIDNASKDNSFALGKAFLEASAVPFKALCMPTNLGVSAGFNEALRHASGDYFSIVAADDWFEVENIAQKTAYMVQRPQSVLLLGNGWLYDNVRGTSTLRYKKPLNVQDVYKKLLLGRFNLFAVGTFFKLSEVTALGGFDEKAVIEDMDLFLRIAQSFTVEYLHSPLSYYRINTGSQATSKATYIIDGFDYIFQKHKDQVPGNLKKGFASSIVRTQMYVLATYAPSVKSLKQLLVNFQPNYMYCKQIVKCCLGLVRKKA